ncbi:MAG TPA: hotdog domain-containing protein [Patescibacteria group bacterium]|jgi:acyl-CoA thioesterase YciA|nr:hotdog domain-containing protein [Patescibacteria group bacterium]
MNEDGNVSRFFNKGAGERKLTFQLSPKYTDTAKHGDKDLPDNYIGAGWLLAEMDQAAGLRAHTYTGGRTVTRAIKAMSFDNPVKVGDFVQIFTEVVSQGRSSLTVKVESWAESRATGEYNKVTEGMFTFVAVNENHKPVDIATGLEITGRPQRTAAPDPPPQGTLIKTVIPGKENRNYLGDVFGGWVLAQMDDAATEVAGLHTGREVATRGIEDMAFHKPVFYEDEVSFYGDVVKTGNTSVTIKIEAWAKRKDGGQNEKVTEGLFTYVALDKNRTPVTIVPQQP